MKHSDAFPSKFLAKEDVAQPLTATIRDVYQEKIKGDSGDETKAVMSFREDVKPMIVNNTNWTICEEAYGEDSDDWIGKKLEIYMDPSVMFGGKRVGGVRVRVPAQPKPATNGHAPAADSLLSKLEAVALLVSVGLTAHDLVPLLSTDEDGKPVYIPERDTQIVRNMVAQNTPQEQPF